MTTNTDRIITDRLQDLTLELGISTGSLRRELMEIVEIASRSIRELDGGFNVSTDPAFIARHAAEAAAYNAERQTLAREHRILKVLNERIASADALDVAHAIDEAFPSFDDLVQVEVETAGYVDGDGEAHLMTADELRAATELARAEVKRAQAKAARAAKRNHR
jgi:hypothetical protein